MQLSVSKVGIFVLICVCILLALYKCSDNQNPSATVWTVPLAPNVQESTLLLESNLVLKCTKHAVITKDTSVEYLGTYYDKNHDILVMFSLDDTNICYDLLKNGNGLCSVKASGKHSFVHPLISKDLLRMLSLSEWPESVDAFTAEVVLEQSSPSWSKFQDQCAQSLKQRMNMNTVSKLARLPASPYVSLPKGMKDLAIVFTTCNFLSMSIKSLQSMNKAFASYPKDQAPTLIIVDDHSVDGTPAILRQLVGCCWGGYNAAVTLVVGLFRC